MNISQNNTNTNVAHTNSASLSGSNANTNIDSAQKVAYSELADSQSSANQLVSQGTGGAIGEILSPILTMLEGIIGLLKELLGGQEAGPDQGVPGEGHPGDNGGTGGTEGGCHPGGTDGTGETPGTEDPGVGEPGAETPDPSEGAGGDHECCPCPCPGKDPEPAPPCDGNDPVVEDPAPAPPEDGCDLDTKPKDPVDEAPSVPEAPDNSAPKTPEPKPEPTPTPDPAPTPPAEPDSKLEDPLTRFLNGESKVSEEQLYAGVLYAQLEAKQPGLGDIYKWNYEAAQKNYAGAGFDGLVELPADQAMYTLMQAGHLDDATVVDFKSKAFTAAQLDNFDGELYDGRGGTGEPGSVKDTATAIDTALDAMKQIDSGSKNVIQRGSGWDESVSIRGATGKSS